MTTRRRSAGWPIGTRAFVEGPYGNLTGERGRADRVLLLAAGIGVTPLRALLEEFAATPARHARCTAPAARSTSCSSASWTRSPTERGARVMYLVGSRRAGDADAARSARTCSSGSSRTSPTREVYLCGPERFMDDAATIARGLGVPSGRIHQERFFD